MSEPESVDTDAKIAWVQDRLRKGSELGTQEAHVLIPFWETSQEIIDEI